MKEDSPPTALDLSTLETRVSNYTFDFQVTEYFIAFCLMPLVIDEEQMRRSVDGSDMRWVKGPTRGNFHGMGGFDDGQRLYVDLCFSRGQLLPFIPHRDGTSFDPALSPAPVTRVSVDTTGRNPREYRMEQLYPHAGTLPRQDDRYHTLPCRYGFLPCPGPADDETVLAEGCFGPRRTWWCWMPNGLNQDPSPRHACRCPL